MTFTFLDSMLAVAGMLIFAVPGFLFIKTKLLDETSIPNFAKLLLYVCQPCLSLYSFNQATKANINPVNVGIVFLLEFREQALLPFLLLAELGHFGFDEGELFARGAFGILQLTAQLLYLPLHE